MLHGGASELWSLYDDTIVPSLLVHALPLCLRFSTR